MFGPRLTTVFRSRWRAVWWAISVLVGVYFSVPKSGDDDADPASKDAEQAIAALVQQQGPAQPVPAEHHSNPWAKSAQP